MMLSFNLLLFAVVCSLALTAAVPVKHSKRQDAGTYDFIIIGGGTAGLALAARLSESGTQQVLVLEAGGSPEQVASYKSPGADLQVLGSPIDWRYTSLPQPSLNGRQIGYNAGRCLGGSSAINGLTYGRGSAGLYNLWERLGNENWSWADVLPYFDKSTTFNPPTFDNITGLGFEPSVYSDGPVQVGYPGYTYSYPGSSAFVESMSAIGVSPTQELNAGNNTGAKQETLAIDAEYQRSSSYDSYYSMAKSRSNLEVRPFSPLEQLILEDQGSSVVATGAVFTDYATGQTYNATASKEIILSAGSLKTPQLLMISGIGPAKILAEHGIQSYVSNENIGKNMQDHSYFSIMVQADAEISYDPLFADTSKLQSASAAFEGSAGPLIAPVGTAFAFESIPASTLASIGASALLNRTDQAHIEYLYETIFYPNYPTPQYTPQQYNTSYVSLTAATIAPVSRGSISILSNSLSDPPQIDLQYYTDPTDQAVAIYAFKNLRKILAQYATYNYTIGPNNGEVSPGLTVQTDKEILEYIRETAVTVWHASGTCAMLPREAGGVVDARLKLYGVQGLRIADASIFPVVPDQHTQAATYMVAEKAAAMILEDHDLATS